VLERRPLREHLRFGLFQLRLVLILLDREEEIALLHARAVGEVDILEEALDARDDGDRVAGDGVAGEVEVVGDVLRLRARR
jgi:hypothetical protein